MADRNNRMTFEEIRQDKERFLREYNLMSDFARSGLDWNELMAIAKDFDDRRGGYAQIIQKYLSEISGFKNIHSYRHRIKETDSLVKKIITKTCEKKEPVTLENYRVNITDLTGIRVLYVFKSDYYSIHEQIWQRFRHQLAENIHIKLREGDDETLFKEILKHDPMIEKNSVYRSIHYTIYINEHDLRDARLEIQTRTIFEEGWSEVNHKLVYKNKDVADYFVLNSASRILSALVGNCDTLGELMKNIHNEYLQKTERPVARIDVSNSDEIMQKVLAELLKKP